VQRNVNMNLGTLSPYSHCITVTYFMLPETVYITSSSQHL